MEKRKNCGAGTGVATLGGLALGSLLGTTFLCGTAAPAFAAAADDDMLDVSSLERVTDGSLDDLRGGFNIGGYEVSFGITVTTTVNGQQLLQTSFNVNDPGQIGNVVTSYIQQQQAALANGGGTGGSSGGQGGNSLGNIDVEIEVDEDGEIDVDVDVDVDDDAPEVAQAIDSLEAAMEALENGGGQPAVAEAQVAAAAADFQQGTMAPLAPATEATGSTDDGPGDTQIDLSGIESPAVPNVAAAAAATWIVTELQNGMQVSSTDLATTIMQQIGNGVSTSITNSANNMTFEHTTEMNVFLENFAEMQAQAVTSHVISSVMADLANQSTFGN